MKYTRKLSIFLFLIILVCSSFSGKQTADEFAKAYLEIIKRGDKEQALTYKFKLEDEGVLVKNVPELIGKIEAVDNERFLDSFNYERKDLFNDCKNEKERTAIDSLWNEKNKEFIKMKEEAKSNGVNLVFGMEPDNNEKEVYDSYYKKIEPAINKIDKEIENIFSKRLETCKFKEFQLGKAKAFSEKIFYYYDSYIIVQVNENKTHKIEVEKLLNLDGTWRILEHN